ncbi:uncharacterized protein SAPINGB_P000150 [Magnusiomyces paraingens]|uniref:Oxidation resistance protein 1 n=1 Tax=Magnusiomyces paraingens TaxID=2606893 RepID=A0A5E8AXV9_9ASCO|nr:uncharacterized protein SAPINGB_P000150 [Saprochaete ingens]VVT43796.1 unnamed protein product [Saprochaete ingens]
MVDRREKSQSPGFRSDNKTTEERPRSSFTSLGLAAAFMGQLRRLSGQHNSPSMGSGSGNSSLNSSRRPSHEHAVLDPPPLSPLELVGYSPRTKTRLLTPELAEEIRALVPARHQLYDTWTLVYSLEQHGASLATLYSNNAPPPTYGGSEELTRHRHGLVLVIKDRGHRLFGAYVNEHFHTIAVTGSRRYYGNGDCFLWTTNLTKERVLGDSNALESSEGTHEQLQFKAFPYTGVNDFVIYCTPQFLSMGGGDGHYGLWIDDNLEHGVSNPSLTFGNEPLSGSNSTFDIVGVEVWRIG